MEDRMDNIGRMIKELRRRRGLTLQQLGDAVGKTAAYMSIIENKRQRVRRPLLDAIAKALGVESSYFIGTDEEFLRKKEIIRDLQALINRHGADMDNKPLSQRVPVINDISAGLPFSRNDPYPVGVADEYVVVPADLNDPSAFGLRIKGDSMEPRLCEGDIIVVCPGWKLDENKVAVAKVKEDEVTCKVYQRNESGQIVLKALNPKYEPQVYDEKQIVWIYPVARAITNLYE